MFDSQSATVVANPTSKTIYSPATTLSSLPTPPTRTNYTFNGWYTAPDGGGTVFTASTIIDHDFTVYASWIALSTVGLTFSLPNSTYQGLTFASTNLTISRGNLLTVTPSSSITGTTSWTWYFDNVADPSQTTSTFVWDSTGKALGQYLVSVTMVKDNVFYSSSFKITVVR